MQYSVTLFRFLSKQNTETLNLLLQSITYILQQVNTSRLGCHTSLTKVNLTIWVLPLFKELPCASVNGIYGRLWRTKTGLRSIAKYLQWKSILMEELSVKKPSMQWFPFFNCTECFWWATLACWAKFRSFVKVYINCMIGKYFCLRLPDFESNQENRWCNLHSKGFGKRMYCTWLGESMTSSLSIWYKHGCYSQRSYRYSVLDIGYLFAVWSIADGL